MDQYPLPLRVELLPDGKRWRLLAPFSYRSSRYGFIAVPDGFVTDFATVPRLPFIYAILGSYGHKASVIHDWLYSQRTLPRKEADCVFYEALRTSGVARWRCLIMWCGVRLGGGYVYAHPRYRQSL